MTDTMEDSHARNGSKEDQDGKRKRSSSGSDDEDKKKRVKWAGHLHDQFLRAVQKLGEKAVPSAILNEMGVEGLTRENVASHLQKYRVQTREKLLSEYLKSNSSAAGFGALDDMRVPPSDGYSQPPPEAYLRRRSESELSYYHSHNYRNPVHPYPPYHLPPSAVHSSSTHAPPPPPPHSSAPSEPPSRSGPYDHPYPPNYHGPPHPNNYPPYQNYGYGHSGNGRSASFSYNPRDYHGGGPPAAAGGYSSIEPFADFDSPPSWRTGQQLVVSSQPPPLPPTQQRSGSFSEPAPRRPSYNEAMLQQQVNQPPPPPQQTFAEPPARRPSFSGEGRRGSFSTEGRRGSFSMAQQPPQQQQSQQSQPQQQPPQHSQHSQHSQPPQQHPSSHSALSSLPPLPPPPSIRTSYDSVPTSVLTGGSSNYFDVNTPTSSEYSSDVLLSLSENHASQMTPTTINFPPPSPSPEPSSLNAQSKDPFSDFPHIGNGGQTSSSYSENFSSPYPAHAHAAPNAGYSNYHHACGNNWCTGCNKVEEQV